MFQQKTLCPFCLASIPLRIDKCPECNAGLPLLYIDDYADLPLSIISAVGFGGHGKSVYLASLIHVLDKISLYWPGFYRQALNQESIEIVMANKNTLLRRQELPKATARNFPIPSIHKLVNTPYLGSRRLLIYDTAGENFLRPRSLIENANYVKRSPVVLFFISLPLIIQEEDHPADEMAKLLQTYILGMRDMGVKKRAQKLVVVYTWGDAMEDLLCDHPELNSYIQKSELEPAWDMPKYLKSLTGVSSQLSIFTQKTMLATNFYEMAKDNFTSVNYTIVSSLGRAPVGSKLSIGLSPRRVIDPLIWVLCSS